MKRFTNQREHTCKVTHCKARTLINHLKYLQLCSIIILIEHYTFLSAITKVLIILILLNPILLITTILSLEGEYFGKKFDDNEKYHDGSISR